MNQKFKTTTDHDEEYHSASRKLPTVDEVHQDKLDEEEAHDNWVIGQGQAYINSFAD